MTSSLKIGFVGLGRMGLPMAENLLNHDISVVVFDQDQTQVEKMVVKGAEGADSVQALVQKLGPRKIIWMMIPAGKCVDEFIESINLSLNPHDILIDGGNSDFIDSQRRHAALKDKNIYYFDVGTSGGLEGAHTGASFSVSGDEAVFQTDVLPLLNAMGAKDGLSFTPFLGMGHFTKCVHNAVEYVLMQAIAESFDALAQILPGEDKFKQLQKTAETWSQEEQVGSYLLELLAHGFSNEERFNGMTDAVGGGESGSWAIREARRLKIETPLMDWAVAERTQTKQELPLITDQYKNVEDIKQALEAVMTSAYKEGFCILKKALQEDFGVSDTAIFRLLKHISAGWSVGTIIRSHMLFQFLDENSISTRQLTIPDLFLRKSADRSFVRRLISYQRHLFGGHGHIKQKQK